jgi:hypothetical protein
MNDTNKKLGGLLLEELGECGIKKGKAEEIVTKILHGVIDILLDEGIVKINKDLIIELKERPGGVLKTKDKDIKFDNYVVASVRLLKALKKKI